MKKFLKDDSGFTLVELMVVVAIISILSTIAIPNFKKFQAKAKTSEAKLHLSSIYSAEVAFLSDADVYATCLKQMGYDPSGQSSQRYYSTGFNTGVDSSNFITGNSGTTINGVSCTAANVLDGPGQGGFAAGKITGGKPVIPESEIENTWVSEQGDAFRASAQGWISPSFIKEKNSSAFSNGILNLIVGQAYASGTEDSFEAGSCDSGPTILGSSIFSINDEKSLISICNGY